MDYKNVLENQIKELEKLNSRLVESCEKEEKVCEVARTIMEIAKTAKDLI
ncbi:hypothetical protein [Marinisporobacter balticus]|uniref:Uncharacterized protein n=1 Tax=Marinisporobacter balticus TaxID=2018667 RepID=A0A4R2K823_9FIRM|nr:hypothetical protein [Marinisporobacter balticus]TCO69521.1 hypothetical protein EV214_13145 [Marinisporobacter balticus]